MEAEQQKQPETEPEQQPRYWMRDPPTDRPVRVYDDRIYDLIHFGHARSLEQAKKSFPNMYLLVGCCNDEVTHKLKGRTIMTDKERYKSLRHCRVITQEFIDKHQIDYVAHDSLPYADASGAGNDVYEFVRKIGRFKETKQTDGISTSGIIMRIVKDYNEYVMRNLDRGYSRKELRVSYVKEKRLRVNMGLKKLREKVKKQQEKVEEKIRTVAKTAEVHRNLWVENADRLVAGFLEMFEEGCHKMGTANTDRIREQLMAKGNTRGLMYDDAKDDDEDDDDYCYDYSTEEEDYYTGKKKKNKFSYHSLGCCESVLYIIFYFICSKLTMNVWSELKILCKISMLFASRNELVNSKLLSAGCTKSCFLIIMSLFGLIGLFPFLICGKNV